MVGFILLGFFLITVCLAMGFNMVFDKIENLEKLVKKMNKNGCE